MFFWSTLKGPGLVISREQFGGGIDQVPTVRLLESCLRRVRDQQRGVGCGWDPSTQWLPPGSHTLGRVTGQGRPEEEATLGFTRTKLCLNCSKCCTLPSLSVSSHQERSLYLCSSTSPGVSLKRSLHPTPTQIKNPASFLMWGNNLISVFFYSG